MRATEFTAESAEDAEGDEQMAEMTFARLVATLGENRPVICKLAHQPHFNCALPFQPFERIKQLPECSITFSDIGHAVFEIPIEEGIARIIGKVYVEDDGTQTLRDVVAYRIESQAPAPN